MNASAITLIIVGAVLILAPLVLGFELREHAVAAYSAIVASGHTIAPAHPARGGRLYGLICLVTGLACLVTGIVRSRNAPNSPAMPISHRPAA